MTADTITDGQIRELMVEPGISHRNMCLVALLSPSENLSAEVIRGARAYCAEILSARRSRDA